MHVPGTAHAWLSCRGRPCKIATVCSTCNFSSNPSHPRPQQGSRQQRPQRGAAAPPPPPASRHRRRRWQPAAPLPQSRQPARWRLAQPPARTPAARRQSQPTAPQARAGKPATPPVYPEAWLPSPLPCRCREGRPRSTSHAPPASPRGWGAPHARWQCLQGTCGEAGRRLGGRAACGKLWQGDPSGAACSPTNSATNQLPNATHRRWIRIVQLDMRTVCSGHKQTVNKYLT